MMTTAAAAAATTSQGSPVKTYDYLLKFLLVGDSDVGKGEILESLQDGASESPYAYSNGIDYKTTTILLDGRRVKLELWDTSGQGRFCTIFRSYSRGAQGILLVYDITNRWSFDGIDRWIKEIDEHAPGVPRILKCTEKNYWRNMFCIDIGAINVRLQSSLPPSEQTW
ncbi:hypothetical protein chiPu_0014083 [Chiloscyllium punctatum]|uniref:SOCS box domain-containing protein n=1 Tax=Chiloscyllium punctatum TaxID=137246 RepID=A0A401SYW9_CHIPU|nr:hypothetical protein [Chiloscyllium punctatum]